jgi:hypothetical protein
MVCVPTCHLRCAVLHDHTTLQLVKDTLRSNIAIDAMRIMLKLSSPSESTSSDDFSKAIDAKEVCTSLRITALCLYAHMNST